MERAARGKIELVSCERIMQWAASGKARNCLAKRSRRFDIELSLRYREKGAVNWLDGKSVNISTSGVLFRSGSFLPPETALEIALTLPVAIPGERAAEILCQGRVIRNVNEGPSSPALAAAFQHYRIARLAVRPLSS
jgi:hypothetical protein